MRAFGHPDSLVREYDHWVVLVRPKQVTLGALVMACKERAQSFGAVSREAFREHERVVRDIEQGLKAFSAFEKINYLMLMMVDKEVHYHVLPRYSETRNFEGVDYPDPGWPAVPDLTSGPVLEGESLAAMVAGIRGGWPD
ncbi:MAG TPA: HIT family protein [Rhodospirillales bacterium]|nr:HIT family protein [Rhodospirillales bacterium]